MAEKDPFDRGTENRESAKFKQKIKTRTGEREEIHKKTFTKWINAKLSKASPPVVVHDLVEDLRDGHVLITLLEVLLNTKLTREKGRMRLIMLTNITKALSVLEKNGVKIVGISNYDIADGKTIPILGLMWSIILRFQVQEIMIDSGEPTSPGSAQEFNVEKKLLMWCEDAFEGYEDAVKLKDFTSSWRDGLAFNAIIHAHKPDLFEFDDLLHKDNKANLEHAFVKANEEFAVPHLLEPTDIDVKSPDKKLIMMYLTSLYDALQSYTPPKTRKEQRLRLKQELEAYRTAHSEVTLYITQVETIVSEKLDNIGRDEDPAEEYHVAKNLIKDIENHKPDVVDVVDKGNHLQQEPKISEADKTEISNQLVVLENRWEKLILLSARLNKRCHAALILPTQQQIQFYITWIRKMRGEMNERGNAVTPEDTKREAKEQQDAMADIERKQPEVQKVLDQVTVLCSVEGLEEEDRGELQDDASQLRQEWEALRGDAIRKNRRLQEAVAKVTPAMEPVTVTLQSTAVESAPPGPEATQYNVEIRRVQVPRSPSLESRQKTKLLSWKRKHDEARTVMDDCGVEVKKLKLEKDPRELKRQLEKCDEKLLAADPMVIDATNHGQLLLEDATLEEQDKDGLGSEMEVLVADYDDILRSVDDERNRVQNLLDEDEAQKKRELAAWEDAKKELKPRLARLDVRLKSLRRDPPIDGHELMEYATEVEACHNDVTSLVPEFTAAMDDGNLLLRGGRLDERERGLVFREMQELDTSYEHIKDDCVALIKRVDEATANEARRQELIESWNERKNGTIDQMNEIRDRLEEIKTEEVSDDPKKAREHLKHVQDYAENLEKLEPEVQATLVFGQRIRDEPALIPDEKAAIDNDMLAIQEQLTSLRYVAAERLEWLVIFIENEESAKEDKLERWNEAKDRSLSLIDACRQKLDGLKSKPTPTTTNEVIDQMVVAQECSAQLSAVFPEIQTNFDSGNNLLADDTLSEDDRQKVQADMETIGDNLGQLQGDIDQQKTKFEELFKTLEMEEKGVRRVEQLSKWDEYIDRLRDLLKKFQAKLVGIKSSFEPKTAKEFEERVGQTSALSEEIVAAIPDIQSGLEYGNQLLEDEDLSDQVKDKIENEMEETGDGFKKLKSELDDEHRRLEALLEERRENQDEKLKRWKEERHNLATLLAKSKATTKELTDKPLPTTRDDADDQIEDVQDFMEDMEEGFPEVKKSFDYGNALLDDQQMDENEKDVIEKEVNDMGDEFRDMRRDVVEHYAKLKRIEEEFPDEEVDGEQPMEISAQYVESAPIDDYLVRLDDDISPQERKEHEVTRKRDRWGELRENLTLLLDGLRGKLDHAKEEPKTRQDLQSQIHDAKECKEELVEAEPAIKRTIDFANDLLDDDDVSESDKEAIKVYISTLKIDLIQLDNEADHQCDRLTELLDKTADVPDDQTIDEEMIDRVHWERPELEFYEPQKRNSVHLQLSPSATEHHFVIRPNQPVHIYIDKLHDELTDEERHELAKRQKVDRWQEWKDRLDQLRDRLKKKLEKAKSEDGKGDWRNIRDRLEMAKDCKEELEDNEPRIKQAVDFADHLLEDEDLDEVEKQKIRYYLTTYQVQIVKVDNEADEEIHKLEDQFEKTPHPALIVIDEAYVEEAPIEQQFHEKDLDWVKWDLDVQDGRPLRSPTSPKVDQIVNIKIMEKKAADHYVDILHQEMTPEERAKGDKMQKMSKWKNYSDWLDELFARLKTQLESAKEKPKGRKDVEKKLEDVKECQEDLEHCEPKIKEALDYAHDLLEDDSLTNEEKGVIRRHLSTLEAKMGDIQNDSVAEEVRLYSLLDKYPHANGQVEHEGLVAEEPIDMQFHESPDWHVNFEDPEKEKEEVSVKFVDRGDISHYLVRLHEDMGPEESAEDEKLKKMHNLADWKDNMDDLFDRMRNKLEEVKVEPKSRKDVEEKLEEVKECQEELEHSEPKIKQALDCAHELLDEGSLADDEKKNIELYITSLEMQMGDIQRESIEEEARLYSQLDKFPRLGDIIDQDRVVAEEPIDQQFHESPEWNVMFEDDPEKHREKIATKFVDRGDIHLYITKLHEDITPEERAEAEKQGKLDKWKRYGDWLDELFARLKRKLEHTKEHPKSRRDVEDKLEDVKECHEDLDHCEPKIKEALDCAHDLLEDDSLTKEEKNGIRRQLATFETQMGDVQSDAAEQEDRLYNLLDRHPHPRDAVEPDRLVTEEFIDHQFHERPDWDVTFEEVDDNKDKDEISMQVVDKDDIQHYLIRLHDDMSPEEREEAEKKEKQDRWARWKLNLDDLMDRLKRKLNRAKSRDPSDSWRDIHDKREDAKDCKEELEDSLPHVKNAIECANELLDDDDINEAEKEKIRSYIATLEIRLKEIQKDADDETRSLEDLLEKTPHPRKKDDRDFAAEEFIDQRLHERPDWDVRFEEEEEEEKDEVAMQVVDKDDIHHYFIRLHEDTTPEEREEAEKREKQDRWSRWKLKLDDLTDRLKRKLNRAKSRDPTDSWKDLHDKRDDAQECKEELEDSLPQIKNAIECANELLDDDDISEAEKENVRSYITTLEIRLKEIQKDAEDEIHSLDDRLDKTPHPHKKDDRDFVSEEFIDQQFHESPDWDVRFEEEEQKDKDEVSMEVVDKHDIHHYFIRLHDDMTPEEREEVEKREKQDRWGRWKLKLDDLMDRLKRKLNRSKSRDPTDSWKDIRDKREDAQECKEELEDSLPQVKNAIECANELLDDDDISETEKEKIRSYITTLEIRLKQIQKDAEDETHSLDDLLDKRPHPHKKDESDFVSEEFIDQQFHESPDWDVRFEEEEQKDKDHVSMEVVDKHDIHHYFIRLHDDMTPEEREEAEKNEKLDRWGRWKLKLDDLVDRLNQKLNRAKTRDPSQSWKDIHDKREDAKDCKEELEDSLPQVKKAIECANELLDDDDISETEKENIRSYITTLEIRLKQIQKDAEDETRSLDDLLDKTPHPRKKDDRDLANEEFVDQQFHERPDWDVRFEEEEGEDKDKDEVSMQVVDKYDIHQYFIRLHADMTPEERDEAEKKEKLDRWGRWKLKLEDLVDRLNRKLNRAKSRDPSESWKAIHDKREDAQDCKEELEDSLPQVKKAIECANELLDDDDISEAEKEKIRSYITTLEIRLKQIQKDADDETRSLDDLLDKIPHPLKKDDSDFVSEELVDQQFHESPDWDVRFEEEEHKDKDEVSMEVVDKHDIHHYLIRLHDDMTPEEREEAEKKEKLDRWSRWKLKLDDLVDRLKRKLNGAKSRDPSDSWKDIRDKREDAQECKEELEDSLPHVKNAIECANELLDDDDISEAEKEKIRSYITTLEIRLKEIQKDAEEETHSLDDLLDKTPHPHKKDDKDLANEEFVDQQFHERPDWDVRFEEEEEEEGKDKDKDEVSMQVVDKQDIHHYFIRLHDDMTPEERAEAEQREKLDRWRRWKLKLDDLMDRLKRKLNRAKSRDPSDSWKDLRDKREDAQDCKEEVEDSLPQVKEAMECANELLDDDDISEAEKENIRTYITTLETRLKDTHKDAEDETRSLDDLLDKTPHPRKKDNRDLANEEPIDRHYRARPDWDVVFHDDEQQSKEDPEEKARNEKLSHWRSWRDKLDDLIEMLLNKLKRVKLRDEPMSKKELDDQQELAKECKDEADGAKPDIKEALACAHDLLEDDSVSDEDKDEIRRYLSTLNIHLATIRREAQAEQDRLDGVADDVDAARKEKLARWETYKERLLEIHGKSTDDLGDIKSMPHPKKGDEFDEQMARTESFLDDMSDSVPEIRQCLEYGNHLLDDDSISDEDKDEILQDMNDIGQMFKDTKHDVDQHYQWLKNLRDQQKAEEVLINVEAMDVVEASPETETLLESSPEEEQERERLAAVKEAKLATLKGWRSNIDDRLEKLKAKLKKAKSRDGLLNKWELEAKKTEVKECTDELKQAEPEIKRALDNARDLLKDDTFSDDEKDDIRRYITIVETQIASIRKEANDELDGLDIEIQQLEAEKAEKLYKWKKWNDKISSLLVDNREKIANVKRASPSAVTRLQIEENIAAAQECEDGLEAADPEIKFAMDYGRQLSEDPLLDETEQKGLKKEVLKLEEDVSSIRSDAAGERQRLYEKIHKLEADKVKKMDAWNMRKRTARLLLERMRTKVGTLRMKLKPRNKAEITARLIEVKDCDDEIRTVDREVTSSITHGRQLITKGALDESAREKVKDDIDDLQEGLDSLRKQTDEEKNALNALLEEEEAIKMEKLQKFRDWRQELKDLMDKLREKLRRLPKSDKEKPLNDEEREELIKLSQECTRDLEKCEEEASAVKDYGKGLLDDDVTDDERRMLERELGRMDEEIAAIKNDTEDRQETISAMFQPISDDEADAPSMVEWRDRVSRMRYGYQVAEEKLEFEEPVTKAQLEERLEDIRELNVVLKETEPEFLDTIDFGKELLSGDTLPHKNRLEMKDDILSLAERWHHYNTKARAEEQRLESQLAASEEQSRELVSWHEQCDGLQAWTDNVISLLEARPVSPGQSFGNMKRQLTVTEDVVSQLMEKQIEVNDLIDDGNKFLDDTSIGDDERTEIHEKMLKLHQDWDSLSVTVSHRQENIQDQMVELEQQHQDMLVFWRKRYSPLMLWISQAETRLSKEFAIAPDLDSVKKQLPQIKSFIKEKESHQKEVSEVLEAGEHLVKAQHINEEDKAAVQKEMGQLQHRWEELDESLHWKQERIEDTSRKLQNQQEDKLRKWDEGLDEVNKWVIQTRSKIRPEPLLARDVDSAYDQIDSFQDIVRDAPIYQDKVTNLNEFSSNLVTDPCLGEQERDRVDHEMDACNKDWNEFVNIANARQSQYEVNLNDLENLQADDFNTWTSRSARASELLDKFESDMPTMDEPLALTLEEVEKQDREFDVFANQIEVNESQLKETIKLGEEIRRDPKYSKAKRDGVHGQLNLLISRWDRIKDFIDLRKGRLEEAAKRLRQDRESKRDDWDARLLEFDKLLNKAEKDFRASDSIADDLPTLKRQQSDFKKVADDVQAKKRKVNDFDRFTDKLSADPAMDDVSRDFMRIEKEARVERWDGLVDRVDKHQAKLGDRLRELEKGQGELSNWQRKLDKINSHVTSIEAKCGHPVEADLSSVEKQKEHIDEVVQDADLFDVRVKEFLKSSEDLMDKPGISSSDRRTIDKECDQLETRWHRAKMELGRNEKGIDEKRDALLLRLKTLLSEWETKKSSVSRWLSDTEARVKTQAEPSRDLDHARAQKREMETIRREISKYSKQVNNLEEFADTIAEDPCMRELERRLVTNEKESIKSRYDALDRSSESGKNKVNNKIDEFEQDQRDKMRAWENKAGPLNEWLGDAEVRVESYDPIGYDIPMVKEQHQDAQTMLNELKKEKPKFKEVREYGTKLSAEPCIGAEEKKVLQDEMTSQQEQWNVLYGSVTSRHEKIQQRLKELEEEEKERKQREEQERKKREEERKRKEEERKAEEKRKQEEEAEKKRQEEEARKREENERKEREMYFSSQLIYEPRVAKPVEEIHLQISPEEETLVQGAMIDEQFGDPFSEAENESRQKLSSWRDEADQVRQWLKAQEFKVKEESKDEDIVGLKDQRKDLLNLDNELVTFTPKYEGILKQSEDLAEDQFLGDEERGDIQEEMDDITAKWDAVTRDKDAKKNRLDDKIAKEERQKLDNLIRCRADLRNFQDWIASKNNEFDNLEPIADDLKGTTKQKDHLKNFSKSILDNEPKFDQITQSAIKLSKDPALSQDESFVIQQETEDCEERWDNLNEKVGKRVDSVVHKVLVLQKKQKELLDEWKDKTERFEKTVKKADTTLDTQTSKGPEGTSEVQNAPDLTSELKEKVDSNETVTWRSSVDDSKDRLSKVRIKLQRIQRDKRNRKWSILEAIKEVFGFGKREPKPSVQLDRLIEQMEDHEDLMQETSSMQRSANDVFQYGNTILHSNELDEANEKRVDGQMRSLNKQWNELNVGIIDRENRLEQLAKEIEDEYEKFDRWRDSCENMAQFVKECDRLAKQEEKIGSDIETLQTQLKDCQEFKTEITEYNQKAENVFELSQELLDSGRLDKADADGVDQTRTSLRTKWKGINDHLKDRQEKVEAKLMELLKKDTEGRLWRWRHKSIELETSLADANRKLKADVDETDFVAIRESAVEVEALDSALDTEFNLQMNDITDSGLDIVSKKALHPAEEGEVSDSLNTLNKQIGELGKSSQEKKHKIKRASGKFFSRSLSDSADAANRLEETAHRDFSDVGADIGEVQKQMAGLQEFEEDLLKEEDNLEDIKSKLQESKGSRLLPEEEEQALASKIDQLDEQWDRIRAQHGDNKKRLAQSMLVLHEELMEEVNDWLEENEKHADSIDVNQDDILSAKEEYLKHTELKDEIASFDPTFKRAISLSEKLLTDRLVDPERAESYEKEINSLEERMNVLNLKTMDNGNKLGATFARHLTTRLDDAEVSLTDLESRLGQDDKGYIDLDTSKKQIEISKAFLADVKSTNNNVDVILLEADELVDGGYFKKHEEEHFQSRIDKIRKRNGAIREQAEKDNKRIFDTYILLLRQHLNKMDDWLTEAEKRIKDTEDISPGYDNVKKQLEEHQVFQDEIREHSMITVILDLDITDPIINESVQSQVKSLSERWASIWRWSEERRTKLLRRLSDWQKFRDEQLILLNWLSNKEKVLKDIGATDLSDEEEVTQHLNQLKDIEKELDQQGIRLQDLHKTGEDLLKEVDSDDTASKEIKQQLEDFDDCWNDIAKQVIDRIHTLEASQSKLKEFHSEMEAVNEWMDDTEKVIGNFKVGMSAEEATDLQEKVDVKCDERSKFQVRVDRINRLGKDLGGNVDQNSHDAITGELEPFNERWGKISEQLENLSDKGYPMQGNECCLVRIMRRKLGICQ